jgi:hypothetical protein
VLLFTLTLLSSTLRADDLPRQAAEILSANCLSCHGAAMQMSDLDLRSRQAMLRGGKRGPALTPGDAFTSRLLRMASHLEQPSMPPGKKLQDWQLAVLRQWIATGAPLDQPIGGQDDARKALASMEDRPITEQERQFWAFQPVRSLPPPAPANRSWMRNPIDAFLLDAMEQRKLRPSPEADTRTLVRRAYLDLWGLPPTLDQVQEFLNDTRTQAWERLIDKLLDSPHYGERWARHWLDLVRYADSGGFEYDRDRPDSWRYRDWVVRAFTNDMPYDEFVRLQIAGDEIDPSSHDALIATGFLRLGPEANIKTEMTRMDELDDILSTTSSAFLGVTLGCARCHDHKFDPIPQKDYYRMQAVFFSTKPQEFPLTDADRVAKHKQAVAEFEKTLAPLRKEREAIEKIYRDKLAAASRAKLPDYIQEALRTPPEKRTEGQRLNVIQVEKTRDFDEKDVLNAMSPEDRARHSAIEARIEEIEKNRPRPLPSAMAIAEAGVTPEPSYFLHRGSPDSKGSLMSPGVLSVIARKEPGFPPPPENAASSHRRKAFAQWLTSPDNPLFTRVMVNRLWQHHFGEGLVRTPNNFGKTGEAPTHPLLLDWLSSEFLRQKWTMKAMHRLMMTSSVYRMASDDIPENRAIDAGNRYLWRMPLRRLEGEIIRDSILAAAGTLNRTVGGPGVYPYIDPSLWQGSSGRKWPGKSDDDPAAWRRSIYVFSKRSIPLPMLEVFDKPDSFGSCARRNRSTIAPQALILMNNSFVRAQAGKLAERIRREAGGDAGRQVQLAFELGYSRPPSTAERTAAIQFLATQPEALSDFCQALFNSNEFVYTP